MERFPIITAGVSFEGSVLTFFEWLKGANIPLSPQERDDGHYPVVGAGGAITYINPLLLAGVCDFIILGDGLDDMEFLTQSLRRYMEHGDRKKLWRDLAENKAILVPPVHITDGKVTDKRVPCKTMPLSDKYPMYSTWTSPKAAFGETLLFELQRGCARNCSYCTLPGCFGRMRYRPFDSIKEHLDNVLDNISARQIGLVTPEAGDYPDINKLIDYLEGREMSISFASLRIDRLTEKMIKTLTLGGRHSITVAPETGSDELRFSCGKKFTNDLIIEKLSLAAKNGINQVKLYFMVGLPGETDEDIASITLLCRRIIEETGQNLILSVNPFVPKPGTPWFNAPFAGAAAIRKKYNLLAADIRSMKKKAPQLRLTSPKEAEQEFDLAWYGYSDSRNMADTIEAGAKPLSNGHSNREITLSELELLW